jgi:hypothetical protein
LVCFADRAGLSSVAAPFALRTEGELAVSFTDIRLAHTAVRQCQLGVEQNDSVDILGSTGVP